MSGASGGRSEHRCLEISGLRLSDERVAHPLAMRSYWEVIGRACSDAATRPVKGVVMVVILYSLLCGTYHQPSLSLAGTLHLDLLLYCAGAEYVSCVWLHLVESSQCLAWLLTCAMVTLGLTSVTWDSALLSSLSRPSAILLLHMLLTSLFYHTYKLFIDYMVYWVTPDYRHLCSHWLSTDGNKNHMLVAKHGSEVCGTIGISHVTSSVAMFKRMVVDPGYRGKGIGKKLVLEAINYCKGQGYEQIILNTTNYQWESHQLYQKMGFKCLCVYVYLLNMTWTWYYLIIEGQDGAEMKTKLTSIAERCNHKGIRVDK